MSIDGLKRVIWGLQEMQPTHEGNMYSLKQVRLAIMEERGFNRRTLSDNISRLVELGLLRKVTNDKWHITREGSER
ncbi:hypothetical protein CMI37_25070 [Candidatus Pacearchaeota archaeon]|nr:hypothetical protein [Candidatus Pacearchaeota archaeon]